MVSQIFPIPSKIAVEPCPYQAPKYTKNLGGYGNLGIEIK